VIRIARLSILVVGSFLPFASASPQALEGVWQSQGYGNVYEIRGATLNAFEVTTQTCVHSFTANRLMIVTPGREATFKAPKGDMFVISAGGADDHKLLNHLKIDRLPRMPGVCDPPTANTPLDNFDVFTRTFAEHYVAFSLRHIAWDKVVADNRQKVTSRTTPTQLFDVLESMIKPLGDLHTGIGAPKLKRESQDVLRPGTDRVIKGGIDNFATKGRRALFAGTDRAYLHGPLRNFCNGQIQYGHVNDGIGYLRIYRLAAIPSTATICTRSSRRWIGSCPILCCRRS